MQACFSKDSIDFWLFVFVNVSSVCLESVQDTQIGASISEFLRRGARNSLAVEI